MSWWYWACTSVISVTLVNFYRDAKFLKLTFWGQLKIPMKKWYIKVSLAPFLYNKFEMAASITVGNQWGKILLYNGFKYQKNRLRTRAIYWRCWRKECRANLQTNVFDLDNRNPNIQILQESSHTHEEDDLVIGHDRVHNTLRNNIRQNPSVPIKRVYDHVARNYPQGGGDHETIQEFHRVRPSMTHARLEHVPAVPHDINDVSIRGLWKRTWSEDRFLLCKIMTEVFWSMQLMKTWKIWDNAQIFIVTEHFVHVQSRMNSISQYMGSTEAEFCVL